MSSSLPSRWPLIARRALMRLLGASLLLPPAVKTAAGAAESTEGAAISGVSAEKRDIWTKALPAQRVWSYADRHSVLAGETFNLMLSVAPGADEIEGHVEIFRIGDYPEGQKQIWASRQIRLTHQPISLTAAAVGANWVPFLENIATAGWEAGCYFADFIEDATGIREPRVAQIVVRNRERTADVLLKIGTNTYQAYNRWGGYSLYPGAELEQRGTAVSFDRPAPGGFFEYDVYLIRWLDALANEAGFKVDYATNFDVHHEPELMTRYRLVICSAHDEYWSKEEFDAFERRISQSGKNTIFFGGNTAYWQIRYADVDRPPDGEDRGRQMVCYKSLGDPILRRTNHANTMLLATARFRDARRRPETMLLGIAYQNWFSFDASNNPRFAYYVESADEPFFADTGYKPGDFAANVAGYEWDNRDPQGDGQRLWDRSRSQISELPADRIKVLLAGKPVGEDGVPGRAEAVYFTSPAGAKVFSAGSIRWAWGLGKPGFEQDAFKRLNRNLVLYFLDRGI